MTAADLIAEARRLGDPTRGDGWRRLLHGLAEALEQSQRSAANWEARANRMRYERDEIRKLARQARNEADDLADAVDCLDQIGQMVGFSQADWGPVDRQRLVREVWERLAAGSSSTEPSADA
jgi:hypothetical protein